MGVGGSQHGRDPGDGTANVQILARLMFTRYLLAFEITSVLLVIAVVGAVVLVRRPDPSLPDAEGGVRV